MCIKKGIKWWTVIFLSICLIILGILCIIFFTPIIKFLIEFELNHIYKPPTEWWQNSSQRLLKVYVYNVTNSNDFLMNKSKANLNELGPYVYDENWEYINVVKNPNGTITFNLNIYRNFRRDLSNSSENDIVIVPNTQMLRVLSPNNDKRVLNRTLADQFRVKPFEAISVKKLLWANDNSNTEEIENPGVFTTRNNIVTDRITVYTGTIDSDKKGLIDQYNSESKLTNWSTDYCNRLNGSFGTIFPRKKLTKSMQIDIFNNDLKRIIPLYFKKETTLSNGIHGYRYTMPDDFYENPNYIEENSCYCPINQEACPETKNSGLFKISLNEKSSHIIYSLPHFYLADPSLRNYFKGISTPQSKLHQMYADIHPKTGITLRYRTGLQINLVAAYGGGNSMPNDSLNNNNNKLPNIILPLVWFEESNDNLPDDIIYLTILAKRILFGIIAILFILAVILLILSIYILVRSFRQQKTLEIQVNMDRRKRDPARTHVHVKRRQK